PTASLNMGASVNKGVLSLNSLKVYALSGAAQTQSALDLVKGQLVYEAAIPRDLLTPPPLPSGARPTSIVRPRPSADVIEVLPGTEFAPVNFNRQIPARFVAELDLNVLPPTDGGFNWNLRSNGTRAVALQVDPANEIVRFNYRDAGVNP